jgi:hypothetical protein
MEHSAILGGVDPPASEHLLALVKNSGLVSQFQQELDGLTGDPVLGIIEQDIPKAAGEVSEPDLVTREEIAQMKIFDLLKMGLEFFPGVSWHRTSPLRIYRGHRAYMGNQYAHQHALLQPVKEPPCPQVSNALR